MYGFRGSHETGNVELPSNLDRTVDSLSVDAFGGLEGMNE